MGIIFGEVVDDAGLAGVDVAAAEVLGADDLAGSGLDQGRTTEEDRALFADDHGFIRHRRDVGAAGGAGAHHGADLGDAALREVGLVVEDAAEVVAVGEDLVLLGQEGAAGVDQVDAGQMILQGDLLGAQVLFDRHRVIGAAFDRGVVSDDHAAATLDHADSADHASAGGIVVIEAAGGQGRELEEGRAGIAEAADPLAGRQLVAVSVALHRFLAATGTDPLQARVEVGDQLFVSLAIAHADSSSVSGVTATSAWPRPT